MCWKRVLDNGQHKGNIRSQHRCEDVKSKKVTMETNTRGERMLSWGKESVSTGMQSSTARPVAHGTRFQACPVSPHPTPPIPPHPIPPHPPHPGIIVQMTSAARRAIGTERSYTTARERDRKQKPEGATGSVGKLHLLKGLQRIAGQGRCTNTLKGQQGQGAKQPFMSCTMRGSRPQPLHSQEHGHCINPINRRTATGAKGEAALP